MPRTIGRDDMSTSEISGKVRRRGAAEGGANAPAPAVGGESEREVPDLSQLETRLIYRFKDRELLELALTHRSAYSRYSRGDYERLEFLGDAVLDLAIAHMLLENYPGAMEGQLSKMRAALVNTASLADIARAFNLGPHIRLSRGESAQGGAERSSILADVLEAIIGAVYRDGGYDPAFECAKRFFEARLASVTPSDPKTELQEVLHARGNPAPRYLLECVEGPEHNPTFISVVEIQGQIAGRGRGGTKKASQQAAAALALQWLSSKSEQSAKEDSEEKKEVDGDPQ